ncbi:aldo/keto reductase [Leifsonia sp. AG29]|uniref:aldo/keto reductase n=1 Tax=Leifsonia sp. AG29 TaxID=2598860 RepID=UPI00131C3712|nr:aldo/keto reductase [Leifsonia sp. AG29]
MTTFSGVPDRELRDGRRIPQLGFGVYKIPEEEAASAVLAAIESGYRHVDTAAFYDNEVGVGEGIRRSGLPREEIFITTKAWWTDNGYDSTLRAFDASLARLGLDSVDLYMIHWPAPASDRYVDSWRALEALRNEGRATSIGVANFHVHHLERLFRETGTVPVVNQVELHPWLPQRELRRFHVEHGIATQSWSPLARGLVLEEPVLRGVAQKYGVSPAQVVIRWQLDSGNLAIPKSASVQRMRENLDVFGFRLDGSDMSAIASLENGRRTGVDPDDRG